MTRGGCVKRHRCDERRIERHRCDACGTVAMSAERPSVTALPQPVQNKALEAKARAYFALGNKVKQQLGPTHPQDLQDMLSEDFEFVAPLVGPLTKAAIVEATKGLDLAAAIPDFDARYHDFRADPDDAQRIWCQMRVTGTQTGELFFGGLGGVSAKPRDPPVSFNNPPEAVSLKFDDKGRVRQITTGYPLDRRVGTTGGLGGLFGVFEGLGYPLPTPLTRTTGQVLSPVLKFFGSPAPTTPAMTEIDEADALPQEVLLQLTSDLIGSGFGTAGSCASDTVPVDFWTYIGPSEGALLHRHRFAFLLLTAASHGRSVAAGGRLSIYGPSGGPPRQAGLPESLRRGDQDDV